MALVDSQKVAEIIRDVAEEAVLPRFRNLADDDIKVKTGPTDLVTVADVESERLLTAALTKLLPGSVVVGEEAAAADDKVLERLHGDAPVWILDPVDGTLMFAKGDPGFAMIVALAHKGRTISGWIHDPVGNRTAAAEEGGGAWLDGKRLKVNADGPIAQMAGAVWWQPAVNKLDGKVRQTYPWGSAGRAYMAIAEGELDFIVFRKLNPWDHAAGVLLHQEAGGKAALVDSQPYRPVMLKTPLLLAPGPKSWDTIETLIRD
jgi:fructose-1,6-bisphosphatase/inositol monophosphatase family enzyme